MGIVRYYDIMFIAILIENDNMTLWLVKCILDAIKCKIRKAVIFSILAVFWAAGPTFFVCCSSG